MADEPTTGPPDFIGVGTQRSGTTWWFRTLLGHPQIRPPRGRRKELHFFDRFCTRELGDGDIAEYHELFPRLPGQIAGEWTPRYYRRTLAFLGVDAEHRHDELERRRGTTQASQKKPLWDDLMEGLHAVLEPEVRALAAMTPEVDVSLWRNFAHLAAENALPA